MSETARSAVQLPLIFVLFSYKNCSQQERISHPFQPIPSFPLFLFYMNQNLTFFFPSHPPSCFSFCLFPVVCIILLCFRIQFHNRYCPTGVTHKYLPSVCLQFYYLGIRTSSYKRVFRFVCLQQVGIVNFRFFPLCFFSLH